MPAIVFDRFVPAGVLQLAELPVPAAGGAEVVVKVAAATVNRTDLLMRSRQQSSLMSELRPPFICGQEFSGFVHEVGEAVDRPPGRLPGHGHRQPSSSGGWRVCRIRLRARGVGRSRPCWLGFDGHDDDPDEWPHRVDRAEKAGLGGRREHCDHRRRRCLGRLRDPTRAGSRLQCRCGRLGRGPRAPAPAWRHRGRAARRGHDARREREIPHGVDALVDAAQIGAATAGLVRDGGVAVAVRRAQRFDAALRLRVQHIAVLEEARNTTALTQLAEEARVNVLTPRVSRRLPLADARAAHELVERGGLRGRVVLVPSQAA